ncbi:MAG: electron transfer flavoprotein subunit beta/FixA family protein [Propionibacteriaceae bacterium]|jgi:electron transfer flavoprotein beta subunit|nr:electron transfer flavoprotein subunit beta/FixA family protein [Propionibacteriaceae bacterium]
MTDVIVGCKWVLDEADVRVQADQSVDFSLAKSKISEYDKNAIEAAVQLAQQLGGKAVGVTAGPATAKKALTEALTRGLDEAVLVDTGDAGSSAQIAAQVLAAEARERGAELIVVAEGSSDDYARQTPSRAGAILDWPVVTAVSGFAAAEGQLKVSRAADDAVQELTVTLPAVISVLPEACDAPIPSLKAALAAKKKPASEQSGADLGVTPVANATTTSVTGYASERQCVLVEGDSMAEKAAKLAAILKKEGVL